MLPASLPVRGAWIEIVVVGINPLRGVGRSPCGERGLKCQNRPRRGRFCWSLPVRGAWIEIRDAPQRVSAGSASLPVRGAWIEMQAVRGTRRVLPSLPVRGAWIEIVKGLVTVNGVQVAPRAGSVD